MHINTAFSNEGSNVNCALCTAAALTGQSSGDVNAELQLFCPPDGRWGPFESDQAFIQYARSPANHRGCVDMHNPAIQPIADQMMGIANYVVQKNRTSVKFAGDPRQRTRGQAVIPFMNRQPNGTEFAVFTSDGASIFGDEAHWIYAKKQNGSKEYFDYQTDRQLVPNSNPSRSNKPLRPGGTAYQNANNTYMIAVAFGANLVD